MKTLLRISLFALVLVVVATSLSLFPQSWLFVAAEQAPYPPPDLAHNTLAGEPYPPPSLPSQPPPYPPPESEGGDPIDNKNVRFKEALLEDAKTYASIYDVSVDEAAKRLTLQGIAENLNASLVTKEDATFAGLWIQHEPDYRVIVQFTNNGDVTIKSYIQNTLL